MGGLQEEGVSTRHRKSREEKETKVEEQIKDVDRGREVLGVESKEREKKMCKRSNV